MPVHKADKRFLKSIADCELNGRDTVLYEYIKIT